ncbi:MAG: heparan-alpha-glucosaminide N-acetyltransferase domain-containing protein [Anaerolineae bacterium]
MSDNNENHAVRDIRQKASRLFAPDALRGLIIIFMALDHANHFIAHKHPPSEIWDGVFPVYYDVVAFLTRLVTHLAAPGFFFLMGVGMLLFAHSRQQRGWGKWPVIRHFLIRGLVLIALQLLIVNRAWELSPGGWGFDIYFGVLCALGGSMILGSLLLWLPPAFLLLITLGLFVGIEFLHPGLGMWNSIQHDPVNVILLRPGGTASLYSLYPVLAWLELVTFGMFFGHWLKKDPRKALGRAWKNSWIDFLNPVKYPPSMTFTLMTTGVNMILLWLFSLPRKRAQRWLEPLAVFGRAPLFFYVLHLFLYLGMGYLLAPNGTSIPIMYPFWLLGLLILFPLTWWYGRFKRRQPVNSILRFL